MQIGRLRCNLASEAWRDDSAASLLYTLAPCKLVVYPGTMQHMFTTQVPRHDKALHTNMI